MAVFIIYGAHWCQVAYSFDPLHNLTGQYGSAAAAPFSKTLNAGAAFYDITMMLISCIFFIGSLRTNIPFALASEFQPSVVLSHKMLINNSLLPHSPLRPLRRRSVAVRLRRRYRRQRRVRRVPPQDCRWLRSRHRHLRLVPRHHRRLRLRRPPLPPPRHGPLHHGLLALKGRQARACRRRTGRHRWQPRPRLNVFHVCLC